MLANPFIVARSGKQWSVGAGGEVLALAATKRAATELATAAADILDKSRALREPRSFAANDAIRRPT